MERFRVWMRWWLKVRHKSPKMMKVVVSFERKIFFMYSLVYVYHGHVWPCLCFWEWPLMALNPCRFADFLNESKFMSFLRCEFVFVQM